MTEVTKCRVFAESTDLGISAMASPAEMKGKRETFAKHNTVQGKPSYERLASFGKFYAHVRGLGVERGDDMQGFRGIH